MELKGPEPKVLEEAKGEAARPARPSPPIVGATPARTPPWAWARAPPAPALGATLALLRKYPALGTPACWACCGCCFCRCRALVRGVGLEAMAAMTKSAEEGLARPGLRSSLGWCAKKQNRLLQLAPWLQMAVLYLQGGAAGCSSALSWRAAV